MRANSTICKLIALLASMAVVANAAMPLSQEATLRSLKVDPPLSLNSIVQIRGGARKRKSRSGSLSKSRKTVTGKKSVADKPKKNVSGDLMQKYKNMLPLTRIYLTMIGFCTLVGLVLGDELTQAILALDPMRTLFGFEFWRFFTAASFLGKPSVGWLMSGYYLFEYGTSLERAYGPAQHLVFLFTQVTLLSILSILSGQPFFANSMITSMLHVLSRAMPNQKVKWLIFTVPYWSLPYGLMITDVLQAQSAAAATPHILGILSGHFYHYHRFIWPKTGGQDWLTAPDFLVTRMDPDAAKKDNAKASLSKALKGRKRGKGKKLGGK